MFGCEFLYSSFISFFSQRAIKFFPSLIFLVIRTPRMRNTQKSPCSTFPTEFAIATPSGREPRDIQLVRRRDGEGKNRGLDTFVWRVIATATSATTTNVCFCMNHSQVLSRTSKFNCHPVPLLILGLRRIIFIFRCFSTLFSAISFFLIFILSSRRRMSKRLASKNWQTRCMIQSSWLLNFSSVGPQGEISIMEWDS